MQEELRSKDEPRLCLNCKHSKEEKGSPWRHRCFNWKVIKHDAWALSQNNEGNPYGTDCYEERKKRWFAKCGMKGKLYDPR